MISKHKEWIKPEYLDANTLQEIRKAYKATVFGSIRLYEFLDDRKYVELEKMLYKAKGKHAKIADRFSYTEMPVDKEIKDFLTSSGFISMLSFITGKKFKRCELNIRKFGHRDYTLLHDAEQQKPGYEFFFDAVGAWHPSWGGDIIFRNAKQEIFRVPPKHNSLTIVNRKKGVYRFLDYVNARSGDNARILIEARLG